MKIQRKNKARPEFSLAAMTDVILLMLIFFMITSSAANQSAIDVKLPKTGAVDDNIPNPLTVSIKPDGSYFVDDVPVNRADLEHAIVNKLTSQTNKSFTIRADESTLHKDVVFAMEIAEKHKFNIAIATVKDK
ncbi:MULTISPECIES: ExbD/TolR family protein [Chryseobacterium]|uniref:Biopolymer transport protein ExbD n=1 Tax=Chryseobacterium camelliae TaxID=1265445 RepID=A0ABU0TMC4_9FLAO|nr:MULTISPECIES: biopolymer transporter ExbD [Chryseobacterium]MDT3407992.1 biopolymer transport protein ExbD [Pseudacidovorax intermedius]MDQ1098151.1 biopolymer transport protein ExbD [Chryseobacterium camelliae]MDQ1102081.1 biopolymer transport protein ExbD [Chryseobacterium sp. SORGH_AS_1048]MDR6085518.1 biopolymer transport protein ExbD [Chryseobacterium sp. SORGH_AS_0909]MDR6129881.1 biopolymer transport protein ExbD [Chryseobacterium sp. SORGH_AS_1175]